MGLSPQCAGTLVALSIYFATGCGSKSTFEFDSLDLAPPHEELSEFNLGQYSIPIPVIEAGGSTAIGHRNHFQMDFELYALVPPDKKSNIADEWAKHQGKIRDRVIRVCRNASVEELQEPELETLKARLMDALSAHVGEQHVRQLLITEVVSQQM